MRPRYRHNVLLLALALLANACAARPERFAYAPELERFGGSAPAAPAPELAALVGRYGSADAPVHVREAGGALELLVGESWLPLERVDADRWRVRQGARTDELTVTRDDDGAVRSLRFRNRTLPRRDPSAPGEAFRIRVQRPVEQLRRAALAAQMPAQPPGLLAPDLVDLATRDRTLRFDIRYATDNNFVGVPFYSQPRAFLQRPAAEALVRANAMLRPHGFGLLVHDAYRPWHVTKMFWDATPPAQRRFVANPSAGSRHNRGAAVDLTLYDLRTGHAIEMPSGYDEFTERAAADFAGGTSRQRWHRDLLRAAMEAHGFRVHPAEWWHFDHGQWRRYPLLNVGFEELDGGARR
jgi:D-alanyl-D-alanine dipeptidase